MTFDREREFLPGRAAGTEDRKAFLGPRENGTGRRKG
jgi:hypothetical protein